MRLHEFVQSYSFRASKLDYKNPCSALFVSTGIVENIQQGCKRYSLSLLGKIVAFFDWKFRSFAFGKRQKIGYKTKWYPVNFTIWFYSALRAANFHIIGQKAAVGLGFPWVWAAQKSEFSVWSERGESNPRPRLGKPMY